jgi:riboflavin biosynthesis pyrimidine reductase/flavin reductase (DIM6/NTAB) family NADH-FMN oxidoreductase RutF
MSSEADRFVFHYLRSLADVILVGAQTVRAENYGPPKVSEARQAQRVARGQAPVPRIAIVSGSLELDWSSPLFTEAPSRPLVLTTTSADASDARQVADVIVAGEDRVDLGGALVLLGEQGVGVVLCEGGPTLNGELAATDLIDELCLTIAPALVGGDVGTGVLGHVHLDDLLPVRVMHTFEDDGDLFLRYRRSAARAPRPVGEALAPTDDEAVEVFNDIVADLEYPMIVVTATDGHERSGCLVGFSTQVSIHPPRYMVWISKRNHTYQVASRADALAVHFPASGQHDMAELFGSETGDQVDKFASCEWHEGPEGAVIVDAIPRWFVGRITETLDSGDHVGFLLQPLDGECRPWSGQLGFQEVKGIPPGHPA